MEFLAFVAQLAVVAVLLVLCLRYDRKLTRLKRLVVSGRTLEGSRIVVASAWLNRRTGLLNHGGLAATHGLWLEGARSVHTIGMLFPIDVVFVDRSRKVLLVKPSVPPGQGRIPGPPGTSAVLEIGPGEAIGSFGIEVGAVLDLA